MGLHLLEYRIEDNQILFTQDDGRFDEFKEFVLAQPEVEKLTWNSKDYYPHGEL